MVDDTAFDFSAALEGSTETLNLGNSSTRSLLSPRSGFWNRISREESVLIIAFTAITALLLLMIISLLCFGTFKSVDRLPEVCLTPRCVEAASSIISAMDLKADPCDDFYQYACGGWIRGNPMPEYHLRWGTVRKLEDENRLIMKNILEDSSNPQISHAERLVKTYYSSCMDTNGAIEKLGIAPIEDLLKSLGDWNPEVGAFNPSKLKLQEIIEEAQNVHGTNVFFDWSVKPDLKNSSRHVITLNCFGGLTLKLFEYFLADEAGFVALRAYFKKLGMLMGASEGRAKDQAVGVVEFERNLAYICDPSECTESEARSERMTILELQKESPFLDWAAFFRSAFKQVDITINPDTEVFLCSPRFFKNISTLINAALAKPGGKTSILADYVEFRTVHSRVSTLPAKFRHALSAMKLALQRLAPEKDCVSDTHGKLSNAYTSMFIKRAFDKNPKHDARSMFDGIKTAFKENMLNLDWMDEGNRALAAEKVDHVTDLIAFPDIVTDTEKLKEEYIELHLKLDAYFENNIKISQWIRNQSMKELNKAPRREYDASSSYDPIIVNAYYFPEKNHIEVLAGYLRAPFYHMEFPRSLNFGALGSVMGHELTHAFDNKNRQYDKEGKRKQLWDNRTIDAYIERAECLVDQYSQYSIDNEHINGTKTLSENIADNGGLKAASDAYRSWAKNNQELPPLPGLNLTHEQLFYVGFAHLWCSTATPELRREQLRTGNHSPPKYRVIGTLSNSVEFAKTFNCGASSKMNPEKKCRLFW